MEEVKRIFDADALLVSLDGDKALFGELVELFADDAPKQLAGYAAALSAGDRRTAERAAHTLKGAAANLSASLVRDRAAAAEGHCRENRITQALDAIPDLEAAIMTTLRLMDDARLS